MPQLPYHVNVAKAPQEVRFAGNYARTGMVMDDALISWISLSADFRWPEGNTSSHHHPFDMTIYILEGRLKWILGDEIIELEAGDACYIPRDVVHGGEPIGGPCRMMEVFAPIRTDYLYICEHQTAAGVPERLPDGSRNDARRPEDIVAAATWNGA